MSRSGAAAVPGPATERLEPAEQLRDFMDGLEQRVRMPLGLEQRRPIRVGTFLREPTASLADGYADRRIASGVGPTSPQPPTALEQIIAQPLVAFGEGFDARSAHGQLPSRSASRRALALIHPETPRPLQRRFHKRKL